MTREYVHDWFSRMAAGSPGRTAVEAGAETLTYGELEARSNRLAQVLLAAGLPRGGVVCILAEAVPEIIAAILAVLKAGGIFVPLDPRTPERRLRALVAEVSAQWFVTESKLASLVGSVAARPSKVLFVDAGPAVPAGPGLEYLAGLESFANADRPSVPRGPDEACYVYFTSGSTGKPKGITGRLKAIDHYIRWEIETFGIGPQDRVSQLTTPSFDASLRDFFTPLCAGGTVCVPPPGTVLDAQALADWIDGQRITLVHCVPSVFRTLLNERLEAARFPALRHVLMAGEAIPPADVRKWFDAFGTRIELVNLYGPSETTMTKFVHRLTAADLERRSIPIGKPMPGASAIVVDERGNPCPPGAVGEIYIRTPYRSLGYFGRDDLTKAVFVPNPFGSDPADLVYKTGDLGRMLKDGLFELIGRRDHQVKIRGERVELQAIETALRAHPSVVDVAVVDLDDESGGKYLCAYVVARTELAAASLREFLLQDLPGAMVPSSFAFLDALPRLINGKVDRSLLRAPDREPLSTERQVEAPRTPTEERLAAIFSEVLRVTRIGVHESFFDLGGHSLLATQLVSRVRRAFGVPLAVRSLFDAPTVAGIAEHVDALLWTAQQQAAGGAAAGQAEVEI